MQCQAKQTHSRHLLGIRKPKVPVHQWDSSVFLHFTLREFLDTNLFKKAHQLVCPLQVKTHAHVGHHATGQAPLSNCRGAWSSKGQPDSRRRSCGSLTGGAAAGLAQGAAATRRLMRTHSCSTVRVLHKMVHTDHGTTPRQQWAASWASLDPATGSTRYPL